MKDPTVSELLRRIEVLEAKINAPQPVRETCAKCGAVAPRPGVPVPHCGIRYCGRRHF